MSKLVQIISAYKKFKTPEGDSVTALDDVSLEVNTKEFITLLGPSGCGKTTLLRSISGFEELDSGEIIIDSQAMRNVPSYKRPVNTVFQSYALFPHINVENNIGYGLDVTGCLKKERNRRVKETLQLVGLSGYENRKPIQLSGGEQQRVALARAIINRPKILLLDEPLSALDRKLRQSMQLELKNIQNELGIAFIFVTHGESNIYTGKIDLIEDILTIKTTCSNTFYLRNFDQSKIVKEKNITVSIRPEELLLESDQFTEKYFIECNVKQIVFLGTDFKILCEIGNNKIIHSVIRDTHRNNIDKCKVGSKIKLYYNPSSFRILKDD